MNELFVVLFLVWTVGGFFIFFFNEFNNKLCEPHLNIPNKYKRWFYVVLHGILTILVCIILGLFIYMMNRETKQGRFKKWLNKP